MSWITNNEWLQPDEDNRIRWEHLRRFAENYRPFTRRLLVAGAVVFVGSLSAFAVPALFWGVQEAMMRGNSRLLLLCLLGMLGLRLFEVSLAYFVGVTRNWISTRLNRRLVLAYYRKILNLSVEDFMAFRQRTNLYQRIIDAMQITPQFTDFLVRGGQSAIMLVILTVVLATVSPIVLGVLALGAGAIVAQVALESGELRRLRKRTLAVNYPLVSKMIEVIDGLFTIKALSASVRVSSDVDELVTEKTDAEFAEFRAEARWAQAASAIRNSTLMIAMGTACVLLLNGKLEYAQVLALYVLGGLFLTPVVDLVVLFQNLSRLSVNVGKFYEVLDLQDEVEESRTAIAARRERAAAEAVEAAPALALAASTIGSGVVHANGNGVHANGNGVVHASGNGVLHVGGSGSGAYAGGDGGAPPSRIRSVVAPALYPPARARGHVQIRDMDFGYRGGAPVLTSVSLEILPGEKVALIGKSGVGKTTLMRLLLGFLQPQRGSIVVDGEDVTALLDKNAYRRQFGVVSQRDVLFGVSIRENLSFGLDEGVSDERMEEALRLVSLWDDVQRLKKGLDAKYGEDMFSGGQKQRFFIARALLRDPAIVLLDEPTSALDFQSEARVMEAIERLVGDRTTITIAHRLSTVRSADRVVVLEGGRIAASGTHAELQETNEYYQALCEYNSFMV